MNNKTDETRMPAQFNALESKTSTRHGKKNEGVTGGEKNLCNEVRRRYSVGAGSFRRIYKHDPNAEKVRKKE